jgi:hypothetical protein
MARCNLGDDAMTIDDEKQLYAMILLQRLHGNGVDLTDEQIRAVALCAGVKTHDLKESWHAANS